MPTSMVLTVSCEREREKRKRKNKRNKWLWKTAKEASVVWVEDVVFVCVLLYDVKKSLA